MVTTAFMECMRDLKDNQIDLEHNESLRKELAKKERFQRNDIESASVTEQVAHIGLKNAEMTGIGDAVQPN
jgi:hypothetical protein